MLHTDAVEPGTLSLLKKLMGIDALRDFSLVGGTALALKYGHRNSEDLDLFSTQKINKTVLIQMLEDNFGSGFEYEITTGDFALFCFIHKIKVDFVYYPHPLLKESEMVEGIRVYSDEDISAMKINAVLGRAVKKDFFDIHELLKYYSLQQIVDWHKSKFPGQMLLISIPNALTYFTEAETSKDPISLKKENWNTVKESISKTVREYLH